MRPKEAKRRCESGTSDLCKKCKINKKGCKEPCPFDEEINGIEKLCDCCEDCKYQCQLDI